MTRRVRWGEFATEFEKGRRRGSRNSNRGWGACRRPHSRQERGPPLKSKAYAIDIASVCSGLRLHHSCIASSCIYFVPIASDHAIEPAVVDLVRSYPRRSTKLYISLALSLVLSLALSHALSLALSRSLSLARSLSRARARAHFLSLSASHFLSLFLSRARALSLSVSHFLSLSLVLSFSLVRATVSVWC
jgi:hypothetical protein